MSTEANDVSCPFCAETIKSAAIKCQFCGEMLNRPSGFPPPSHAPPPPPPAPQTAHSAPAAAAAAAAANPLGGIRFMVREDGKNGEVVIHGDRLVRIRKKLIGKDDIQTIPIKSITGVHHDRKTLGTDVVKLNVGSVTYEWKVSRAEAMVAALHERIF